MLSPRTRKERKKTVHALAEHVFHNIQNSASRKDVYGDVREYIENKKRTFPWLERHQIYSRLKVLKEKLQKQANRIVETKITSPGIGSKGGRPKGSTNAAKESLCFQKASAITKITNRVKEAQPLQHGQYKTIHNEVIKEAGIDLKVPYKTVQTRIRRGSAKNCVRGTKSPVEPIEKVVCSFAIQRQEAGQPLTVTEGLDLANSLIQGTEHQERLKEHQQQRKKKTNRKSQPDLLERFYEAS